MTTKKTSSAEASSPFFIFGCGRSGTSLLSRMLNHHPRIAVPYESHLLNVFYKQLPFYGNLAKPENLNRLLEDILRTDVMEDWDPRLTKQAVIDNLQSRDFKGVFSSIMQTWTLQTGKVRWGEKTPHHVHYWRLLDSFYPHSKFIHIYRDGRDVALSLIEARFGPKTVYSAAKYWKNYLNQVWELKKSIPPSRFLELSYEELLESGEDTLKRVCSFLSETYDPTMLQFFETSSHYNTDSRNRENLHKPLIQNNKQKWKSRMSSQSIEVFENVAGDALTSLQYPRTTAPGKKLSKTTEGIEMIKAIVCKVFAMSHNRKGIRDARIRLSIALNNRLIYLKSKLQP